MYKIKSYKLHNNNNNNKIEQKKCMLFEKKNTEGFLKYFT